MYIGIVTLLTSGLASGSVLLLTSFSTMKHVASFTATDIDGDTNSSARLMDKPKKSKPAVTFDPLKI